MSATFTLDVILTDDEDSFAATRIQNRFNDDDTAGSDRRPNDSGSIAGDGCTALVVAYAKLIRISQQSTNITTEASPTIKYAAIFLPSTLVEAALKKELSEYAVDEFALSSPQPTTSIIIPPTDQRQTKLSRSLLSMTHPFLSQNFIIKAIILLRGNKQHAPADVILLDLTHAAGICAASGEAAVSELMNATKSQLIHAAEHAVLCTLLISDVTFTLSFASSAANGSNTNTPPSTASLADFAEDALVDSISPQLQPKSHDIPTCPVCLYRIDPFRLGLPKTPIHQLCSKFCPPPSLLLCDEDTCPRQRLLRPWPLPSQCVCCQTIAMYWKSKTSTTDLEVESGTDTSDELFCCQCAMQETLWVCMTCGFVGCGRYSNKHAASHFFESGHPYSLELATLRIWDYVTGEFAHRPDLLECPSSPPRWHQWMRRASRTAALPSAAATASVAAVANPSSLVASGNAAYSEMIEQTATVVEKSGKKATMIGEEYEALLQSALEEQAQHYEGEITRLMATLTAEHVDTSDMTQEDQETIENLQTEISLLRSEIDFVGRELLGAQAQEAGHRATSQRLLREQQVSQELLKKIRQESMKEQEEGTRQIEELEQQIADLTANQRMRDQFSKDKELLNAQIFGATSKETKQQPRRSKSGKKLRRGLFRKSKDS